MTARRWMLVLAPGLLFFLIFFIWPQVEFLRTSFKEYIGPARSGGGPTTDNYSEVLGDAFFRKALLNTARLGLTVSVLTVLLAYPLATAIVRARSSVGRALFVLVVSSMFMSAVVRALGWRVLIGPSGVVNNTLVGLGIVDEPLRLYGSFTGVTIGMMHLLIPFVVLAMIPVIEAVPQNLLRAAHGLGASQVYTFFHVVLPATRRGIVPPALLAFALTCGAFATPSLLGGGRVGVLSIYIRQQTLTLLNYPRGAAAAVVLLLVVFGVFVLGLALSARRSGSAKAIEVASS